MLKMVHLQHKDQVRLKQWRKADSAQLFTLRGHCQEKDLGEDYLNNMINRGDTEVSTIYFGITMAKWAAKKEEQSAYYRDRVKKSESAIILEDGQIVEIEGRKMQVSVDPRSTDIPCSSYPISFKVVA